jgi:hypothetical protein
MIDVGIGPTIVPPESPRCPVKGNGINRGSVNANEYNRKNQKIA